MDIWILYLGEKHAKIYHNTDRARITSPNFQGTQNSKFSDQT